MADIWLELWVIAVKKKKSSGNQFCEEEIFCSFFCFLLDLNPHSQKYIPQIFFKRTQSQK